MVSIGSATAFAPIPIQPPVTKSDYSTVQSRDHMKLKHVSNFDEIATQILV